MNRFSQTEEEMLDVRVGIVSRDPYFKLATWALLGKDRESRIECMADDLASLESSIQQENYKIDIVICDLDTIIDDDEFYADLARFHKKMGIKILCLAEANLDRICHHIQSLPIHGLLTKSELGYCLHVALHTLMRTNKVMVTPKVKSKLKRDSRLAHGGKTINNETAHPDLTSELRIEAIYLRVLCGLDNADIANEKNENEVAIRKRISQGYKDLGLEDKSAELDAFNALTEFWRITRFMDIELG